MATEVVDAGQTAIRLHEQHLRQGNKEATQTYCAYRARVRRVILVSLSCWKLLCPSLSRRGTATHRDVLEALIEALREGADVREQLGAQVTASKKRLQHRRYATTE